ncbi:MAG: DNA polymerase III subunit delta [Paludibacteraceae bacterium]|nr:DNA polymerase III subunit delta [Paludibacteraceae bacterium]
MAEATATYEQLLSSFKKREFRPVYFFMGEESYYIDKLADYLIEHVVSEENKSFDQTVVYGKDVDIDSVINLAKRYPMMSEKQLVVVKEAQHLKSLERLNFYLQHPLSSTVLVFCYKYGSLDKRKSVYTTLNKVGTVFESKKVYENQVAGKVVEIAREKGLSIDIKSANVIANFLGSDLSKIANEIDKLKIVLPQGAVVMPADIERNIGISKDYNNFELIDALAVKDIEKANRIVDYFRQNKNANPLVVTLSVVFNFFLNLLIYSSLEDKSKMNVASALKINPFFVTLYQKAATCYNTSKIIRIISYIRETDAGSKGVGDLIMNENELLKLLVFKILH